MTPTEARPKLEMSNAERPLMQEIYGYNASIEKEEFAVATRRYEYALDRREKVLDRTRFGALAINGATLLAVLGAFGNSGQILHQFGVSDTALKSTIVILTIGMALSALAIWWIAIFHTQIAAKDFEHLSKSCHRNALMQARATDDIQDQFSRALIEKSHNTDFSYSKLDHLLINASGSCWLTAIVSLAIPLIRSFNWHLVI